MHSNKYIRNAIIHLRPDDIYRHASRKLVIDRFPRTSLVGSIIFRVIGSEVRLFGHVFFNRFIYPNEVSLMASKKFEWTFVNIKLKPEDKESLLKYAKEHKGQVESALSAIASYGYKFSLSFVDDSNSWCASVSGNERTKFNDKCTITSWSDDISEAIFMAAYKCDVVTEGGDWKEYEETSSNWG